MKTLTDVQGIGDAAARVLADRGIRSVKALAKAETTRLTDIPGFGEIRAQTVIRAAREMMESSVEAPSEKQQSGKEKAGKKKKHKKKNKESKKTQDKKGKKKGKKVKKKTKKK